MLGIGRVGHQEGSKQRIDSIAWDLIVWELGTRCRESLKHSWAGWVVVGVRYGALRVVNLHAAHAEIALNFFRRRHSQDLRGLPSKDAALRSSRK